MASLIAETRIDAADSVGISVRTFADWLAQGCPGEPKNYVIRDIVNWARENKWSDADQVLIDSVDGATDIKERLLKERAEKLVRENRLLDHKISEREANLVDIAEVKSQLMPVADAIREAVRSLERKYGRDAADIIIEAVSVFEKSTNKGVFNCDRGNEIGS